MQEEERKLVEAGLAPLPDTPDEDTLASGPLKERSAAAAAPHAAARGQGRGGVAAEPPLHPWEKKKGVQPVRMRRRVPRVLPRWTVSERQKAPSRCSPAGQTVGAQRPAVQASGLTQSAEAVQS